MQQFILLAAEKTGAGLGDKANQIGETFGVNWPLFVSSCIAFLIVALLLKKLAYQPVLQMLEERRKRIEEGQANAEKIKAELAETMAERDKVLSEANQKAEKLIVDARDAAKQVGEAESEKARKAAEEIIRKAQEATEADRDKMMAELKAEIGRMVVETTAKVTGKVLTSDDHQKLIDETNKELAA
ncbi:MAG: ATP synthase F0 subunit B [Verrucomicrobiales bacterium]|nr:ATP synthase F0 subunit B [Verrucomicrobiales bacterium]